MSNVLRLWGLGVVLTAMLLNPLPRVSHAADERPRLVSVTVSTGLSAGQTLRLRVTATTSDAADGLCCGQAVLQSPSGKQRVNLRLTATSATTLEAEYVLPAGVEGGTWKVAQLDLVPNSLTDTDLKQALTSNTSFS